MNSRMSPAIQSFSLSYSFMRGTLCGDRYSRLREQQQLDPSGDDATVLQALIRLVNEVCSHCFQAYNHHNQLFMQ